MDPVSVVVPTYNRADCLGRAIESALDQTHPPEEVIIVDDGSTDDTPEVVAGFDDDRIDYQRRQHRGANAARNAGIDTASGELISFLDSDNELHEEHLEVASRVLSGADRSIGGVFTAYERRKDGELVSYATATDEVVTADSLRRRNVIGGFSATTFRREVFDRVGPLDESFPSAQDYEFYLRVARQYRLQGVNRCLLTKHIRHDSISNDLDRKRAGYQRLLRKHGDDLHPQRVAKQRQHLGVLYASDGQLGAAREQFLSALVAYPLNLYAAYLLAATAFGDRGFDRLADLPKSLHARLNRRGVPSR